MTAATAKTQALEALQAGPVPADKIAGGGVYLLKAAGFPVVTDREKSGLVHRLVDAGGLCHEAIRQARQRGMTQALRWHRRETPSSWAKLIEALTCPFERDAAADYLRGIVSRARAAASLGGH